MLVHSWHTSLPYMTTVSYVPPFHLDHHTAFHFSGASVISSPVTATCLCRSFAECLHEGGGEIGEVDSDELHVWIKVTILLSQVNHSCGYTVYASPPGMYQAGHWTNEINFNQWNKHAYWITGAGVLQHQWNFLVWVKVVATHTVAYIAPQIAWSHATYYLPEPQKFIGYMIFKPWWNVPFAELRGPVTPVLPEEWLPWLRHMDGSTLMQHKLSTDKNAPQNFKANDSRLFWKNCGSSFTYLIIVFYHHRGAKFSYWFRSFYKNPSTNDASVIFSFCPNLRFFREILACLVQWLSEKLQSTYLLKTIDFVCLFWYMA